MLADRGMAPRIRVYRDIDARSAFTLKLGGISHFRPLKHGSWVVVCRMGKLYIGQGEFIVSMSTQRDRKAENRL